MQLLCVLVLHRLVLLQGGLLLLRVLHVQRPRPARLGDHLQVLRRRDLLRVLLHLHLRRLLRGRDEGHTEGPSLGGGVRRRSPIGRCSSGGGGGWREGSRLEVGRLDA